MTATSLGEASAQAINRAHGGVRSDKLTVVQRVSTTAGNDEFPGEIGPATLVHGSASYHGLAANQQAVAQGVMPCGDDLLEMPSSALNGHGGIGMHPA